MFVYGSIAIKNLKKFYSNWKNYVNTRLCQIQRAENKIENHLWQGQ